MNILTTTKVKEFFPKHNVKAVANFLLLISCITHCRTTCLYKCRDIVYKFLSANHHTQPESDYIRLIRFFKMKAAAEFITGICHLLISIAQIDSSLLIMDRTNWKIGVKNINLLTIGGLWKNTFVPLQWLQLNKEGNSNFEERKKLIELLTTLFQWTGKNIKGMILLADREFIGIQWLEYLLSKSISFVIRLKENTYGELATVEGKKRVSLKSLCKHAQRYGIYAVPMLWHGHIYTFVIVVNPKDARGQEPFLFFISNLKDAKAIADHYLKRWKIECCFKHLKKNGFNIEDMNLKADHKIELMAGVLICTYVMAIIAGIIKKDLLVKKKLYKNGKSYLSVSVFRRGHRELLKIFTSVNSVFHCINSLLKPWPSRITVKCS